MDMQERAGIPDVTQVSSGLSGSRPFSYAELHALKKQFRFKQNHHAINFYCYPAIRQKKAKSHVVRLLSALRYFIENRVSSDDVEEAPALRIGGMHASEILHCDCFDADLLHMQRLYSFSCHLRIRPGLCFKESRSKASLWLTRSPSCVRTP